LLPADWRAVTGAIALRLRGDSATDPVVFAPEVGERLDSGAGFYDGFGLDGITIGSYGDSPYDDAAVNLTGLLHFADDVERRAVVAYAADYRLERNRIVVDRADATPLFLPDPEAELFFVPADKVPADLLVGNSGFAGIAALVWQNAVSFELPWQVPSGEADYVAIALFLDRVAPDAVVELRQSASPVGLEGEPLAAASADYFGYRVLAVPRTLDLAAEPRTYYKLVYTLGDPMPPDGRVPMLAAVFATGASPLPEPPPQVAAPAAVPEPESAWREPVAAEPEPAPAAVPEPTAVAVPTPVPEPEPEWREPAAAAPERGGEAATDNIEARLERLKRLYDRGLITADEFDAKRQEILDDL
jgi:hypothetical protein